MRVFLIGATGNLGQRLIPALLVHKHFVTVYVRSLAKLSATVPPELIAQLTIVVGDATDAAAVKRALVENRCDAIINAAGNQVLPWREPVLPKIAKAVADAAVDVGRDRGGRPLRAWFIGGMMSLEIPKTDHLVQD
jgi:nucleoside-diphosphate-sugar epimerase